MAEPYVGEIHLFAGNFAPMGYAFCNGQLISISQNPALYSLLGTQFGGNGTSTFALPNMQGNVPLGSGQAVGGSAYKVGQVGGEISHTLQTNEMPGHTHSLVADQQNLTASSPSGNLFGKLAGRSSSYYAPATGNPAPMASAVGMSGGGQSHPNQQPFLAISFIIALQGIYPTRQ